MIFLSFRNICIDFTGWTSQIWAPPLWNFCRIKPCSKCFRFQSILYFRCLKKGHLSCMTKIFSSSSQCHDFDDNTWHTSSKWPGDSLIKFSKITLKPKFVLDTKAAHVWKLVQWRLADNESMFLLPFLSECKADCDTCFNKNFCTKCKSGFYLHLGKCLDNCPEGLEANNHTMECISIGESLRLGAGWACWCGLRRAQKASLSLLAKTAS